MGRSLKIFYQNISANGGAISKQGSPFHLHCQQHSSLRLPRDPQESCDCLCRSRSVGPAPSKTTHGHASFKAAPSSQEWHLLDTGTAPPSVTRRHTLTAGPYT